jgi:hypothetical protein
MGTLAYERRTDGKDRPPWRMMIWAVLRGYVIALVFLAAALAVLAFLGFSTFSADSVEPGPWVVDSLWSLAADLYFAACVVVFTSFVIYISATTTLKRRVSPLVVLGSVALTGYAPFLYLRWLESSVLALILTAAAVRYFGIDRQHSLRLGRAGLVVLAVLFGAGTLVALGYAASHPLLLSETGGGSSNDLRYVSAELRNNGFADLRITAVQTQSSVVGGVPFERRELVGAVVSGRDDVRISYPESACPLSVVVRYELGGRNFEQRFVTNRCD